MLKAIKNKRGSVLILALCIVLLATFFTVIIVDFGLTYAAKIQVQTIADATTLAGASRGQEGYISVTTGKKVGKIDQTKAVNKANQIKNANAKFLPSRVTITSTSYNPSRRIDGKNMTAKDQYYSGNFTTRLSGRFQSIFLGKTIPDTKTRIPTMTFTGESRVKVTPR